MAPSPKTDDECLLYGFYSKWTQNPLEALAVQVLESILTVVNDPTSAVGPAVGKHIFYHANVKDEHLPLMKCAVMEVWLNNMLGRVDGLAPIAGMVRGQVPMPWIIDPGKLRLSEGVRNEIQDVGVNPLLTRVGAGVFIWDHQVWENGVLLRKNFSPARDHSGPVNYACLNFLAPKLGEYER